MYSRQQDSYGLRCSGKNKVTELVLRRMKHTPNLKLHYMFSEPTEVRTHGYRFSHDQNGRLMTTDRNVCIELHMSSAQLGWLTVRPIISEAEQRRHLSLSVSLTKKNRRPCFCLLAMVLRRLATVD